MMLLMQGVVSSIQRSRYDTSDSGSFYDRDLTSVNQSQASEHADPYIAGLELPSARRDTVLPLQLCTVLTKSDYKLRLFARILCAILYCSFL